MSLAIAMLPKILRPVDIDEYFVDESCGIQWRLYQPGGTYVIGRFYYDNNQKVEFRPS